MTDKKMLFKDHEAAEMLSIGTSTFRKHVASGLLPAPVKIGGSVRWRVSDLEEWVGKLGKGDQDEG